MEIRRRGLPTRLMSRPCWEYPGAAAGSPVGVPAAIVPGPVGACLGVITGRRRFRPGRTASSFAAYIASRLPHSQRERRLSGHLSRAVPARCRCAVSVVRTVPGLVAIGIIRASRASSSRDRAVVKVTDGVGVSVERASSRATARCIALLIVGRLRARATPSKQRGHGSLASVFSFRLRRNARGFGQAFSMLKQ